MAELGTTGAPLLAQKPQQRTWVLPNFLHKPILFFILVAILPLLPSQAPEPLNRSIISRAWELLRLLFVGIAISYGLFSRRNADQEVDKDIPPQTAAVNADSPRSYVARLLSISSVFDDEDLVEADVGNNGYCEGKTAAQAWSSQYYRGDPVVVLADADGVEQNSKPLSLPVRRLRANSLTENGLVHEMFDGDSKKNVVLPSPIPWRSRSERMDVKEQAISGNSSVSSSSSSVRESFGNGYSSRTPSFRSPTASATSASSSNVSNYAAPSPELMAKSNEDPGRKKSFRKSTTLPPPPPPPPPPFFHHGSFAFSDKTDNARSLKDELEDLSRRAGEEDNVSLSSLKVEKNSRRSSNTSPVSISVRTVRPKENGSYAKPYGKVGSDTALDRMANENRQPHPLLPRSQSDKAPAEKTKNRFSEKMTLTSDDEPDTDDDVEGNSKGTLETKPEAMQDENEVDKKADEFIAKFREQIRLQRIESFKRSATEQRSSKIRSN